MGTRNLTMVISNGETKVAQYGQWDGYPSGNGVIVLEFLTSTNLEEFKNKLNKVFFMNGSKEKEIKKWMKSVGCENGWMNMDQSKLYQEKYPYLTRDNGAKILEMIMEGEEDEIWITDSTDFAGDSLFCEWAYLVDLDKNILEVYEGFNKDFEDGKHFRTFKDIKQLVELCHYYLERPIERRIISEQGCKEVITTANWKNRIKNTYKTYHNTCYIITNNLSGGSGK
jgi:hypothetical protein